MVEIFEVYCIYYIVDWELMRCPFVFQEGTSNYFKGLMLILCYMIVAASFFVYIDPEKGQYLIYDLKDVS